MEKLCDYYNMGCGGMSRKSLFSQTFGDKRRR
jgi:hypothetical protein